MATAILGLGLSVLLTGLSSCLAVIRVASRFQDAQWVLGMGELEYPMPENPEDVMEDVAVSGDDSLAEGYTFERLVEEDEDEDGLYVVRTRVTWGSGGPGAVEEVVQYVWQPEE